MYITDVVDFVRSKTTFKNFKCARKLEYDDGSIMVIEDTGLGFITIIE